MNYSKLPLRDGVLIKRYKRFLADVLVDGEPLTVHCPNSGSMAGLLDEGNPVRISGPHNPSRKLLYTLEQIQVTRRDGETVWVGVNTSLPNRIVEEVARAGQLTGLEAYTDVRAEVKLGDHSRIDLRLRGEGLPDAWVEVKNCTMVQADLSDKASVNEGCTATFPDAVTTRGLKHLELLMERVAMGERAAVVFTVQRVDADRFATAEAYDPTYSARFQEARNAGVALLPLLVDLTPTTLTARPDPLPLV